MTTAPMQATVQTWDSMPMDAPMWQLERRRMMGEKAMLSHITLRKGCEVPTHSHENEQFSAVLSGCLRFGLGAEGSPERREVEVRAGQVIHLPSNFPHSAFAVEETVALDVFSPPSAMTGIDRR